MKFSFIQCFINFSELFCLYFHFQICPSHPHIERDEDGEKDIDDPGEEPEDSGAEDLRHVSEKERHDHDSDIRARHLFSHRGLRVFLAEGVGRQVNHVRINRTVAKTDEEEPGGGAEVRQWQNNEKNSRRKNRDADRDYFPAVQFCREHAGEESSESHSEVVEGGDPGSGRGRHAFGVDEEGAAPRAAEVFERAGEDEDEAGYRDSVYMPFSGFFTGGGRVVRGSRRVGCRFADFSPEREGGDEDDGDRELDYEGAFVTAAPAAVFQGEGHEEGAARDADAVEAVEEGHLSGVVVDGDVVVESGVDSARAEAEREAEGEEPEGVLREGVAEHSDGGERGRHGGDFADAEAFYDAGAEKAGADGAAAGEH